MTYLLPGVGTDPSSGVELTREKKQLSPNVVLRKMIAQWVEDGKKQAATN